MICVTQLGLFRKRVQRGVRSVGYKQSHSADRSVLPPISRKIKIFTEHSHHSVALSEDRKSQSYL
jgi:hypothetical protein